MDIPVTVIRSSRRTFCLQVRQTGEVVLRAPNTATDGQILRFYNGHRDWIDKQMARLKKDAQERQALPRFTPEDIRRLAQEAVRVIPERAKYYAPIVGVTYGRITIRNQTSKWGSCSAAGNLNFNCLLMEAPREVLDYVVVHELCHRLHMNHSPAFWAEVGRVLPDYQIRKNWLKTEGPALMSRMTGV